MQHNVFFFVSVQVAALDPVAATEKSTSRTTTKSLQFVAD